MNDSSEHLHPNQASSALVVSHTAGRGQTALGVIGGSGDESEAVVEAFDADTEEMGENCY